MKWGKFTWFLGFLLFCLTACQQNVVPETSESLVQEESIQDVEEESSEKEPEALGKQEPVLQDGVLQYTFPYMYEYEESVPVIILGIVMGDASNERMIDGWDTASRDINLWLKGQQSGYQLGLQLFTYSSPELEDTAIEQAIDSSCDMLYFGSGILGSDKAIERKFDMRDTFVDLSSVLKSEEMKELYEYFPPKYWDYLEMQDDGIYSVAGMVELQGPYDMEVDISGLEDAGISWQETEGVEKELNDWDELLENIAAESETGFIKIANTDPTYQLACLGVNAEWEMVAPGVGINLKTGEVEKITDTAAVNENAAKIVEWNEKGWIYENSLDSIPLINAFTQNGGMGWHSYEIDMGEESYVSDSYYLKGSLYYPMSYSQIDNLFCGVLQKSQQKEFCYDFLNLTAKEELQKYLCNGRPFQITPFVQTYYRMSGTGSSEKYYNLDNVELSRNEWNKMNYEMAEYSAIIGFQFNDSLVQTEMTSVEDVLKHADAANLRNGNYATFLTDLEELKIALEEAGIDAIYNEVVRQLAEK